MCVYTRFIIDTTMDQMLQFSIVKYEEKENIVSRPAAC